LHIYDIILRRNFIGSIAAKLVHAQRQTKNLERALRHPRLLEELSGFPRNALTQPPSTSLPPEVPGYHLSLAHGPEWGTYSTTSTHPKMSLFMGILTMRNVPFYQRSPVFSIGVGAWP
jgi:hypothetical protein